MLVAMSMTEMIQGLDPEKQFALIVICVGCFTGVFIALGVVTLSVVNSIHRRISEQNFKREMLSMGMSAEDIERVVEAAGPLDEDSHRGSERSGQSG